MQWFELSCITTLPSDDVSSLECEITAWKHGNSPLHLQADITMVLICHRRKEHERVHRQFKKHAQELSEHFTGEVRVSYLIACRLVLLYITDVKTVTTRERGEKPIHAHWPLKEEVLGATWTSIIVPQRRSDMQVAGTTRSPGHQGAPGYRLLMKTLTMTINILVLYSTCSLTRTFYLFSRLRMQVF